MKVLVSAVAVLVLLGAVMPVLAKSDYQSGFEHGVSDGGKRCGGGPGECHWYILQPGKGFQFHTWEFVKGYVNGFCSVPGNEHTGSDADEAAWDCDKGPESANSYTCGGNPDIVGPLYRPCPVGDR
jgi:hypothetical protein